MNGERRSYWFLLSGLVIGVVLGLLYAWVWAPVEHIDTHPITLREDFKDTYREMIALGYVANGDLGRAGARLALLGDAQPARTMAIQAQQTLADGGSADAARALGILAAALEGELAPTQAVVVVASVTGEADSTPADDATATPEGDTTETANSPTPGASATATLSPTPRPSLTPTATTGAPYVLRDFSLVCNGNQTGSQIQIYVYTSGNQPAPGVQALVNWEGGQDSFFTGMKPEIGFEYGDFEMTPGVVYTLRLADGGEPVNGLTPAECTDADPPYFGSWRLNFSQP